MQVASGLRGYIASTLSALSLVKCIAGFSRRGAGGAVENSIWVGWLQATPYYNTRLTAPDTDMHISARELGLHARTVLEQIDKETIAIVVDRKSRLILADGKKLLDKANTIKKHRPQVKVVLKTTAPICSKTKVFLEGEGVAVIPF